MKSYNVVALKKGEVSIAEKDMPGIGPDEVLVEMEYTTISPGTELAFLYNDPGTPNKFPQEPGYSACGLVKQKGRDVRDLEIGQRVVGRMRHTSHAVIKASECMLVSSEIKPEEAAVYKLGSIALQGIRKANIQIGWDVAVIGLGPIGNLAAQIASVAGATYVEGIDLIEWRREIALECGLDAVSEGIDSAFKKGQYHVVVEATGSPTGVPLAFKAAGRRGRVVLLGSTRGIVENVDFYADVHRKGLNVIGAHGFVIPATEDVDYYCTEKTDDKTIINLLAKGRIRIKPLVSEIASFEQAPEVYKRLRSKKEKLMLVVFKWK